MYSKLSTEAQDAQINNGSKAERSGSSKHKETQSGKSGDVHNIIL